jgi:tetratricopeptide (TPR) repeat protein
MKLARKLSAACLAAILAAPVYLPAAAGRPVRVSAEDPPAAVQKAAQLYGAGSYAEALAILDQVGGVEADNPYTRYYKALCCQGLNQIEAAQKEYYWLYQFSSNADIRYKAWQGLKGLERYRKHRAYAGQGNTFDRSPPAKKESPRKPAQTASAAESSYDESASAWAVPGAGYGATGGGGRWNQQIIALPRSCGRR